MSTKYAYSYDEENYHGHYDSPEQAAAEALASDDRESCFVGECVAPTAAEGFIDADLLIEHVQCQDEYDHEWAENWPRATKEQLAELTAEIQKVFGQWLGKHDLRPTFFTVENVKQITAEDIKR